MIFYKVRKNSDQKRFNGSILIANELWTGKELSRAKASDEFRTDNFEQIEVSKFDTYWCFGARFECKINT